MKIPLKIKICGLDYKIKFEKNMHAIDGLAGEHLTNTQVIRLQKDDYCRQRIEQVFIHELVHAIDVQFNNNSLEEDEVKRIGNGLYQVLSDNNLLK